MPDQREAGDGGEEGGDESDRTIARHLDRLIDRLRRQLLPLDGELLDLPVWLLAATSGSTAKLKAGGGEAVAHSSERPSQGSPVSSRNASRWRMLTTIWITCAVAASDKNDDAQPGDQHPGAPSRDVIVLQPARHAQQAGDIERDERHIEADQSAPEGDLPPALHAAGSRTPWGTNR